MFGINTDSNGWAVSGLNACGINPQTGDFLTSAGKAPVDFLIAQQFKPGGGFKYLPSDTTPSAYSSIDGLRAVAGGGFTASPPVPTTSGAAQWAGSGKPGVRYRNETGPHSRRRRRKPEGLFRRLHAHRGHGHPRRDPRLGHDLGHAIRLRERRDSLHGGGTITSLNGKANSGSNTWKVSIDGSSLTGAARAKVINVGDTIALRWGA